MGPKFQSSKAESVRVVVRCRPLNSKETADGHKRIVEMDSKRGLVEVKHEIEAPKTFTFDAVYDWNSKQKDLYEESFRELVQAVLDGFNGTIFAYGQTGTGKTFTMQGVKNDPEMRGVIPNSFDHVFSHISRSTNQQYLVRASYLEIYMEEIKDLLAKDQTKRLELKERPDVGVYVKDLISYVTKSEKEIEHVMNTGNTNRSVGATNMNEQSSRSHAIFMITVECGSDSGDGENHIRVGKLNLVDLAGSERQNKTGAEGDRLKEATKINLSLSALGNVISALVDGKSSHIPYRDSKLTRLLQDSLGGNAKTVMVANIGPANYNYDETVTTLRYANRAKNIKNKPKINEDPKEALLREFQEQIAKLKSELMSKAGPNAKRRKGKNRKTHLNENGEEEYDDDDDEGDEADDLDEEEFVRREKDKLEAEKSAILSNKNLIAKEKDRLLNDLNSRQQELKLEQEKKDKLAQQIEAMESKLLVGGKNIIDHTNEQQRALEQRKQEIAEQQRKEREMQRKLEEGEETALNLAETYNSLQQEVDAKTKKLRKLYAKLQSTKQEIVDMKEEHVHKRQDIEESQDQLTKDLKLKMFIIENFIPPDIRKKVESRLEFDEENENWVLRPLAKESSSEMVLKRPASAATGSVMKNGKMQYGGEMILMVELDMPDKTTRHYDPPSVAPRMQAMLDNVLQDEKDIIIDASSLDSSSKRDRRARKSETPHTKANPVTGDESVKFPTAKGLKYK